MADWAKTIMILLSTTALAACGGAGTDSPSTVSGGGFVTGGGGTGVGGTVDTGSGRSGGTGGGSTGGGVTGGGGTGGGGGGTYPTMASLTGDQAFTASSGEIVLKDTARLDRVDYAGFGEAVEYTAATNTYTLDGIGREWADFTTDPTAIRRRITVTDAGGELAYSRMSRWDHGDTTGRVGFITYGLMTRDEDTPSGSISYRQVGFHGAAFRQENGQEAQYDLKNSTLDLKYDFTTFSLDMLMTLIGTPMAGGADQTLGLFTEKDNTVAGGRNNIDGFVVKQGTDTVMGAFSLRFYGPGADEYGLAFGMSATNELKAAGAAAGRRR